MSDEHRAARSLDGAWKHPMVLVGICLALAFLYEIRGLIVAVLFALTLASAIAPVAEWAEEKYNTPRVITVLGVYIITGAIYVLVAISLLPTIKEQAMHLYHDMPKYASGLMDRYGEIKTLLGENADSFKFSGDDAKGFMSKISKEALHFTQDLMSLVATGILVLFLTSYFVIEAKKIWPALLRWLPLPKRERAASIIKPLEARLGGYVRGQALVSLAVATFLGCALTVIQVDHALILGVLAGLLNLVPFVGSMLTAVLAVLVAFNQSPLLAVLTVGVFALEQWVESSFIVPMLLGSQVELHPLAVLFAILIGGSLLGLPGALIAVPMTTAVVFIAEEFYLRPMHAAEKQTAGVVAEGSGTADELPAILSASGPHIVENSGSAKDSEPTDGAKTEQTNSPDTEILQADEGTKLDTTQAESEKA